MRTQMAPSLAIRIGRLMSNMAYLLDPSLDKDGPPAGTMAGLASSPAVWAAGTGHVRLLQTEISEKEADIIRLW